MNKEEIADGIERILHEWDPIGILQGIGEIIHHQGSKGEYSKYIKPIVETYLSKNSMYDFLVNLHTDLRDYPNAEMKNEIRLVSDKIVIFLSQSNLVDLQNTAKA